MRRGAKPGKAKVKAKPPVARKSLKSADSRVRDLEKRLAESLEREKATSCALTSALDQQTATSEILHVIGSSPTDVRPVFETIAQRAKRLCDARECAVFGFDGALIHLTALADTTAEWAQALRSAFPRPPGRGSMTARAIVTRSVVHVPDVLADSEYELTEAARTSSIRSVLSVPMLRNDKVIGAITVDRYQPEPFSDNQIALLQTFADQAVIAVENVRLFNETKEALEQQTATSEILQVISRSPTNAQPVFDTIAERAMRLCHATVGFVGMFDGALIHIRALANVSPEGVDAIHQAFPAPPSRGSVASRAILTGDVVQIPDVLEDPEYQLTGPARVARFRGVLGVPMLHQGRAIGVINAGRPEPGTFSEEQVQLLKTFADQAVIAIENVRLFKELQTSNRDLTTALDQQTATSDILRVISRSPTDVQPVFDTIVRSAVRLCDGLFSGLLKFDGELLHYVAHHNFTPEALEEVRRVFPARASRGYGAGRAIVERAVVHIPDVELDPEFQLPALYRTVGWRSGLFVPMLREGAPIGVIAVTRAEPGPFSESEIELLKTFADQAVIAIENVRLFTELEARNKDLTATSEVLQVISRSPTDVQPVFDTILANAARLCDAHRGALLLFRDGVFETGAELGTPLGLSEARKTPYRPEPHSHSLLARIVVERRAIFVPDLRVHRAYEEREPRTVAAVELAGSRSMLVVPLLKEDVLIGAITIHRPESGPFSEEHISLLKTFADQAIIAIENVRLFKELEGRNRDLTATGEILRVISGSPTDVQPVFDTIVRSAVRLCDGLFSALYRFDGELIHLVAQHNYSPEGLEAAHRTYPARPTRTLLTGRAILECAVVHVPDTELDPEHQHQGLSRAVGFRSGLYAPMLRDGAPIGVILVARAAAGPFSDSEIELLKTFADQAVIAVENVRLFKELQARTGELTRSVEQLTALGEVSRAVSSTLDVETVLDTIVSRATQLAGADGCAISEYDDATEVFHARATHGIEAALVGTLRSMPLRKGEGLMGRAAETREPVQVADIAVLGAYESQVRDVLIRAGFRAVLSVPLLREEQIIGSLSLLRKAPGEFPPEVVDVLKTFATQSALAIQNARLFREIADKSAQLEAASRHKSEFLANMSHELRTPLNAIIGFSEVLVDRMFGELTEKQDEYLKDIYASGQHLLSLINDILDLSKIEAGRMELEVTDFDLPNAIDNALILVRERASRRGIRLGHSVDERLGHIRGDERKVKQVLLNLLSNALKFTPEGGRIDVSAGVNNGVAEIAVADTGVGIAPEDQEAVFEEFRQVGTADKKVEGTGLGLALSRKFIELHGGRIWVKSQVGHGSTFTFTLPVRREE